MLFFSLFILFLSTQSYSQTKTLAPSITRAEVKVLYECADFPTPRSQTEARVIYFYESKNPAHSLMELGLSLRKRILKENMALKDLVIKFRPKVQGMPIEMDEKIFKMLSENKTINLKCEMDVSYGKFENKATQSCSLVTQSHELTSDHLAFARMTSGQEINKKLSDYHHISIQAELWKVPSKHFTKGVSFERWRVKNKLNKELCLLEASTKIEIPQGQLKEADAAMKKLLGSFPDKKPLALQGQKTLRALTHALGR